MSKKLIFLAILLMFCGCNTANTKSSITTNDIVVPQNKLSNSVHTPQILYDKCVSCHGMRGEKSALGVSDNISTWKKDKIISALQGYKKGTYGNVSKSLMTNQVAQLSDEEIKQVATYIQDINTKKN